MPEARLLVYSMLFPSDAQPNAGLFIRERMFRVGKHLPLVVVAPQPWFPFQGAIRRFRPHFRPSAARFEMQRGFEVHRPRFLCIPGILKWTDGLFMALSTYWTVRRLVKSHGVTVLDAHFGYPDGRAGTLLAKWLRLPVMVTIRGKEERQLRTDVAKPLARAMKSADRLVCVSEALRTVAIETGVRPERTTVIGNGVDLEKFRRISREQARRELALAQGSPILISVGGLTERKGFHRVIECLPALIRSFPDLQYLIVGGPSPEGDISNRLRRQVADAGLDGHVRFLGPMAPERLHVAYSAADLFVLATSYEGWANVFLEAMACGLPIVTTRVGGNAEVVASDDLGSLVDLGDRTALTDAISRALRKEWDRDHIVSHARANGWEQRVALLLKEYEKVSAARGDGEVGVSSGSPATRHR